MSNTRNEWTVLSMLNWATSYFEQKEVKSPRLSIEWLLVYVLEVKRLDLYLKYDRPLAQEELDVLRPMVKRRAEHEPLQYITGEAEFYNCTIKVNSNVLIPRQETEQLVALIYKNHKGTSDLSLIDIGTGSGCIPIALKKECGSWDVNGFDISEEALVVARKNAELNEVDVNFFKHSLFESSVKEKESKYDVIISNPPYILRDEEDGLDNEVKDYEPHMALFCESTEKMYGAIEEFCAENLKESGTLYLEVHAEHAVEVKGIFKVRNWQTKIVNDLDEKPRFLVASFK